MVDQRPLRDRFPELVRAAPDRLEVSTAQSLRSEAAVRLASGVDPSADRVPSDQERIFSNSPAYVRLRTIKAAAVQLGLSADRDEYEAGKASLLNLVRLDDAAPVTPGHTRAFHDAVRLAEARGAAYKARVHAGRVGPESPLARLPSVYDVLIEATSQAGRDHPGLGPHSHSWSRAKRALTDEAVREVGGTDRCSGNVAWEELGPGETAFLASLHSGDGVDETTRALAARDAADPGAELDLEIAGAFSRLGPVQRIAFIQMNAAYHSHLSDPGEADRAGQRLRMYCILDDDASLAPGVDRSFHRRTRLDAVLAGQPWGIRARAPGSVQAAALVARETPPEDLATPGPSGRSYGARRLQLLLFAEPWARGTSPRPPCIGASAVIECALEGPPLDLDRLRVVARSDEASVREAGGVQPDGPIAGLSADEYVGLRNATALRYGVSPDAMSVLEEGASPAVLACQQKFSEPEVWGRAWGAAAWDAVSADRRDVSRDRGAESSTVSSAAVARPATPSPVKGWRDRIGSALRRRLGTVPAELPVLHAVVPASGPGARADGIGTRVSREHRPVQGPGAVAGSQPVRPSRGGRGD